VARRSTPRGRSRKRRSQSAAPSQGSSAAGATAVERPHAPARTARAERERARAHARPSGEQRPFRAPQSLGERPQAPWHPLPLSELLILVGAIATVIGFTRGEGGHVVLFVGIGAVTIGTTEVSLREHLSGYRSHTIILALIPTLVFHSVVVLIVAGFTRVPAVLNLGLLVLDAAVFAVVFKYLRTRFIDARRERSFAAAR